MSMFQICLQFWHCVNLIDWLIVLLTTQVFLKVANSSANSEREPDEEDYYRQMEQLTDSELMHDIFDVASGSFLHLLSSITCYILSFNSRVKEAFVK